MTPSTKAVLFGARRFDPRKVAGLYSWYDFSDSQQRTLNGAGVSVLNDKSWTAGRLENLLLQSEDFSTSWTRNRILAFGSGSTVNATTAPDGTLTADFICEDSTASNTHFVSQNVSIATEGSFVLKVSVKQNGRTWVRVRLDDGLGSAKACYFDVANGVKGTENSATGSITSVANGFYECSIAFSISAAAVGTCTISLMLASSDGGQTYSGGGTLGLYYWGAQLRRSTSSQTYLATTTVAQDATRALYQTVQANQPLISRADNKGNLLKQSEDSSTSWTRIRINAFGATDTGAAGAGSFANTARTTDPLGGNTADFVQEDSSASTTHYLQQTGLSFPPNTSMVFSVWVKAAGRTKIRLRLLDASTGTDAIICYFQTSDSTVSATASGSGSNASGTIVESPVGSGWYLCTLTGIPSTTQTSYQARIYLADSTDPYNGDNTQGVYIWGTSLRLSTWDSDYIATTANPVFPGLNGLTTGYFDGSAYYMKSLGLASLVQPTTVIMVVKQWTWTAGDAIYDGLTYASSTLVQSGAGVSPQIRPYAGTSDAGLLNGNLALGAYGIVACIFNGASSSIGINNTTVLSGNVGSGNANGFCLGSTATPSAYSNSQVAEILIYNRALNASELDSLKSSYLAKKWNISL